MIKQQTDLLLPEVDDLDSGDEFVKVFTDKDNNEFSEIEKMTYLRQA
jgi:hypothetical protein